MHRPPAVDTDEYRDEYHTHEPCELCHEIACHEDEVLVHGQTHNVQDDSEGDRRRCHDDARPLGEEDRLHALVEHATAHEARHDETHDNLVQQDTDDAIEHYHAEEHQYDARVPL